MRSQNKKETMTFHNIYALHKGGGEGGGGLKRKKKKGGGFNVNGTTKNRKT